MDFIDKYLTLTANIKGTLQGTTSFLNSIPANMEDLKAVSDAKAQKKELERLVELINKLSK
tara:strand:+ start:1590 stop:1772 length:183 start_codon:yes stop_codon:yes gene_type:complete